MGHTSRFCGSLFKSLEPVTIIPL
ncbi:hypothetical protein BOSE62_50269 [Bosea sp. 62]|nr:hypothetical protein BOSE21B_100286 [Bosea sp. 21B]CAD5284589.1 hypothetical protein BOSE7B_41244 [Bosea sp. 7B]CAD5301691.1 hypothetical protein BOSE46_90650 [Bosea sp. 46]VVT57814.1 hypothetical protein BOS5A_200285 [Bosea sp. EC-HK365B]VXB31829.1 hypothetical protein BOSE29B_100091 [Bosea sp. 29B]VXB75831.1 hypothetical protein BOSE125_150091 [Bosea sp. 125]VXC62795.1 hypothetical protein BOSE62_50269 [Bosea sp. 62]VXC91737.1 hypothetical protein BOSE127_80028 [Bosea sp. 127]